MSPGYISDFVSVAGVSIALRTLFPADAHAIRARTASARSSREWREWVICHSIWHVDGQILPNDPNLPYNLRNMVRNWTDPVVDAVFFRTVGLKERFDRAVRLLEGYSYEQNSRGRWRMMSRLNPSLQAPAWVSGLGANLVQQLWVAYNLAEDDRLTWEQEWHAAKTVAATMDPKWVKKVSDAERTRWADEEARRREVMNRARQGLPPNIPSEDEDVEGGHVALKLRTFDDIQEQMDRWKRGEMDEHDLIVQEYLESIRKRHEDVRRAHEERMAQLDGVAPGVMSGVREDGVPVVGPSTVKVVTEDTGAQDLFDRYIARDIAIGALTPDFKARVDPEPSVDVVLEGRKVTI